MLARKGISIGSVLAMSEIFDLPYNSLSAETTQ
jgi:hypothetical protein